ncbi:MAG: PaaI family thioesterase [Gammaproteobacteria bacterium]|nr:PaaI family thioesterase [Gammaproteobacteria bacterium]
MTAQEGSTSSKQCFVCGTDNPYGMQIRFRIEGDTCRGEYTPPEHFCGFPGVTHGGILYSLLDDAMANWLYLQGESAYTGRCEVRYREPAATGVAYQLESQQVRRRGRMADMQGRVLHPDDGRVIAEAEARFIVME